MLNKSKLMRNGMRRVSMLLSHEVISTLNNKSVRQSMTVSEYSELIIREAYEVYSKTGFAPLLPSQLNMASRDLSHKESRINILVPLEVAENFFEMSGSKNGRTVYFSELVMAIQEAGNVSVREIMQNAPVSQHVPSAIYHINTTYMATHKGINEKILEELHEIKGLLQQLLSSND